MSADWTVCRDRAGHLLSATEIGTAMHLTGPRAGIRIHVGRLDEFGPLVPVLDADGMPVVRTVGDLTARHASRDVRIGGGRFTFLGFDSTYGPSSFIVFDGEEACVYRFDLDTACEVLP